jgi:hypothetical protein
MKLTVQGGHSCLPLLKSILVWVGDAGLKLTVRDGHSCLPLLKSILVWNLVRLVLAINIKVKSVGQDCPTRTTINRHEPRASPFPLPAT